MNGSGGCNRLMGSYKLEESNRLSFSEIGSTKMACMNMKTEKQLLEVLSKVDNYQLNGDTLEF